MSYDIIGDIHGQASKLEALLRRLGYVHTHSGWRPPQGRQAIFLGDLIDRGPEQIKVIRTVRAMIDAGHARTVMGNHEFNAIGYALPHPHAPHAFLREHNPKHLGQHVEFLEQVGEGSALHRELIQWFRTLPPALDLGPIRVVHAWWHEPYVAHINAVTQPGQPLDDDFLHQAFTRGTPAFQTMEGLTKGREIHLPAGHTYIDHSGAERQVVRIRWWHPSPRTYRDVAIVSEDQRHLVPDHPLPPDYAQTPHEGVPVFIGHYWLNGPPGPQTGQVACLDYSAAKAGPLVAYRWDGESELESARFVAAG